MGENLRIVVVEDDCLIAMDLSELLSSEGHEVCAIAGTEADAIAAAQRYLPDMMIVDCHLSEGSGIAAMREILTHGPMAHVYVSGDRLGILASTPDAVVIDKPFTMACLLNAMAKARDLQGQAVPTPQFQTA